MCRQTYYLKRFHLSMIQIMDPKIEKLLLLMRFVGFCMLPSASCHLSGSWLCLLTELNLLLRFGILWRSVMRTKNGHHTPQMMQLAVCYLWLYSVLSTSKTFCAIVLINACCETWNFPSAHHEFLFQPFFFWILLDVMGLAHTFCIFLIYKYITLCL